MAANKPPAIWSPQAEADLSEIWTYYAKDASPQTADRMVLEICKACRTLEEHPLVGRARDEIRPELRSILSSPYVIFYRVKDGVPQIVRILHGQRDIDEIFSEDSKID